MEGVGRNKVRLLKHNPDWEKEFLLVREEINSLWGENILDIQHVGSTAINGICAKPILDVAVKLKSIKNMNADALVNIGYDYCGMRDGNEKYHLFVMRGENQISLRHIHCYDRSEGEFEQLVGFRDYLNAHHEEARRYQELKEKLARLYPDDRSAYTRGKEEFIKEIYAKL